MLIPVIFTVIGGAVGFKVGQVLSDEDYPGTTVPNAVREEMIEKHIRSYGSICPRCSRRVARWQLEVDHKIPIAAGGRNSRYNLQILCQDCNLKKGRNFSLAEWFTGRKAD